MIRPRRLLVLSMVVVAFGWGTPFVPSRFAARRDRSAVPIANH